ncbi:hypothetical protein MJO28_010054 [Puccinia striiformis f. sp. tritici]|nr:hypothetical protein MJO28_010054 [Puccinia striiformis f. sp. tritici]
MSRATYYNPCGTCSDKAFSSLTAQCGEELAMLLQEFLLLIPSRPSLRNAPVGAWKDSRTSYDPPLEKSIA